VPPTPVPSIQRGVMPSACATLDRPRRETVAIPSMSRQRQARVGHRVQGALHVQLQRGMVRQPAEPIGLGRPRDNHPTGPGHRNWPEYRQAHVAPRLDRTRSGMSSCSASGVAGRPVMLVIIRGPSSSSTTAIAYGASSSKPGAGRWLIT